MKHCLLIDDYGDFLGLEGNRLVLKGGAKKHSFTLDELESVLVTKAKGSVSLAALQALLQKGIGFTIMGDKHEQLASLSPRSPHALKVNQRQHRWREDGTGAQLAQQCISTKVRAQRMLVNEMSRHKRLKKLAETQQGRILRALKQLKGLEQDIKRWRSTELSYEDELFQLEARAAKIYWRAVKHWLPHGYRFTGRSPKKTKPCPLNAALNYGYAILSSRLTHQLSSVGFDPHIGFLHADSAQRASLSYDLIERHRQRFVDQPVIQYAVQNEPWALKAGRLDPHTRTAIARVVLERLCHVKWCNLVILKESHQVKPQLKR